MKILLINKFHYLEGGAERSYLDTADILESHGDEVAFFSMKHPKNIKSKWEKYFVSNIDYNKKLNFLNKIKASINIFYNFEAKRNLEKLIKEFRPEVVHFHNIYRQLSPSIIDVLKKHNIPMVMTLHDYALVSTARTLSVRGEIWEKDKRGLYCQCILDKCVKNSYLKSLIAVIEIRFHKIIKIYDKIDIFISPSQFLINKFREFNFKKEIVKIAHPIKLQETNNISNDDYILYFGRLTKEKGADSLIDAYLKSDIKLKLKIAGTGLEEDKLKNKAKNNKNIEFIGFKQKKELEKLIKNAYFIVSPSNCYENAPYSLLEAMGAGKAVLAPRIGGYIELIEDGKTGYFYKFREIDDFADKIKYLANNREEIIKVGIKAREKIKKENNKEKYYKNIIKLYNEVIKRAK